MVKVAVQKVHWYFFCSLGPLGAVLCLALALALPLLGPLKGFGSCSSSLGWMVSVSMAKAAVVVVRNRYLCFRREERDW